MSDTQYPFDVAMLLHDGAAAVTATGNGQVGGSARIFDTESTTAVIARWPAVAVVNVTALDLADTNETYVAVIEGSNDAAFGSGNEILAQKPITRTGRHVIPFVNFQAGTGFRYLRERWILGGTTPSITAQVFMAPAVLV